MIPLMYCWIQFVPLGVLTKCHQGKRISNWVRSVGESHPSGSSRELPDRTNNDLGTLSGNKAVQEACPISAPSGGCQAAGFHHDHRLLAFKAELPLWLSW